MLPSRTASRALALLAGSLIVAACGGGGAPGDVTPRGEGPPPPTITGAPDAFLLFPNPQVQSDGTLQTNTEGYANAYYEALDPNAQRDTLDKFKAINGFGSGTGEEILVVFGDARDLGYGRRMYVRRNTNGTLAFYVENYLVSPGVDYTYSPLNLEAAILQDKNWIVGVNAIEFGPGPNGGAAFPRWYNFDGVTGRRNVFVDLDNRGEKAMPGPCISCHGGRGDALTPPGANGKPQFNLVRNTTSEQRGDVAGRLHPFEADAFDFSATRAGFTRAEQEARMKKINSWILCTYPLPAPSSFPEDQCRPVASQSEWQGTAAQLIKAFYGGDGLPSATFSDKFVPPSWEAAGQSTLYKEVVAPACRTCHNMRGTGGNSDIDFTTFEKFAAYAERIKSHVFERGNMPLAKIVYDAFWSTPGRADKLARFLEARGFSIARDAAGNPIQPGRPVAIPGPDRVAPPGAIALSGTQSLFSASYSWTLVSGPAGATLTGATTATPTLNASAEGTYVINLVASNGTTRSAAAPVRVVVKAGTRAPGSIRFADIKSAIQGSTCTNCHSPTGTLPRPPVYYTNDDRNGDGIAGDAADDAWYYVDVRGRVNLTEIVASPLLRKPAGNHHGGNLIPRFDTTKDPGHPDRDLYDLFLNWILAGAPQ